MFIPAIMSVDWRIIALAVVALAVLAYVNNIGGLKDKLRKAKMSQVAKGSGWNGPFGPFHSEVDDGEFVADSGSPNAVRAQEQLRLYHREKVQPARHERGQY